MPTPTLSICVAVHPTRLGCSATRPGSSPSSSCADWSGRAVSTAPPRISSARFGARSVAGTSTRLRDGGNSEAAHQRSRRKRPAQEGGRDAAESAACMRSLACLLRLHSWDRCRAGAARDREHDWEGSCTCRSEEAPITSGSAVGAGRAARSCMTTFPPGSRRTGVVGAASSKRMRLRPSPVGRTGALGLDRGVAGARRTSIWSVARAGTRSSSGSPGGSGSRVSSDPRGEVCGGRSARGVLDRPGRMGR